jgi:hypothetical protein
VTATSRLARSQPTRHVGASGYCQRMAPGDPESADAPRNDRSAAMVEPYDPIAEQGEARRARTERDRRLSSAQRLQRLHDLCAHLATVTPARPRDER